LISRLGSRNNVAAAPDLKTGVHNKGHGDGASSQSGDQTLAARFGDRPTGNELRLVGVAQGTRDEAIQVVVDYTDWQQWKDC